jgi:hypothetical protein
MVSLCHCKHQVGFLGLVSSLARPGGNMTGVSVDPRLEIWGKRFRLLPSFAETAGLMAYGTDLAEVFRQCADQLTKS